MRVQRNQACGAEILSSASIFTGVRTVEVRCSGHPPWPTVREPDPSPLTPTTHTGAPTTPTETRRQISFSRGPTARFPRSCTKGVKLTGPEAPRRGHASPDRIRRPAPPGGRQGQACRQPKTPTAGKRLGRYARATRVHSLRTIPVWKIAWPDICGACALPPTIHGVRHFRGILCLAVAPPHAVRSGRRPHRWLSGPFRWPGFWLAQDGRPGAKIVLCAAISL